MPPHPLTNFNITKIQKYYQSDLLKSNLSKIRDGAYMINLDDYEIGGIHWIALYVNAENITYFYSFGVEHTPKEIRKFIENKNITINTSRIQTCVSIMYGIFV